VRKNCVSGTRPRTPNLQAKFQRDAKNALLPHGRSAALVSCLWEAPGGAGAFSCAPGMGIGSEVQAGPSERSEVQSVGPRGQRDGSWSEPAGHTEKQKVGLRRREQGAGQETARLS
jgi:hypothetical protein